MLHRPLRGARHHTRTMLNSDLRARRSEFGQHGRRLASHHRQDSMPRLTTELKDGYCQFLSAVCSTLGRCNRLALTPRLQQRLAAARIALACHLQ